MALNVTRPSRFKSYFAHCETEDQTETVYTCPANTVSYMSLVFITNKDNSATDHALDIYRAQDDDTYHILAGKNLATGEYIQLSNAFIVLEAGDQLKLTPSNNSSPHTDVFTTVEEVFLPNG
jgi:hypothetical protein